MNHHLKKPYSLDEIRSDWKDCLRCPLHLTRTQTVFGSGNSVDPKILVIGQSPSEIEDREGKPFIGNVNWHLNAAMEKAGINREKDCYITNSVICRPWIPHSRSSFPPSIDSIETCRKRLLLEYELIRNTVKVIVLVGKEAYATWMEYDEFSDPGFTTSRITLKEVLGWSKTPDTGIDTYTIYPPLHIAKKNSAELALAWLNDWKAISAFALNSKRYSPRRQNGQERA